jgi:hypothetical protein
VGLIKGRQLTTIPLFWAQSVRRKKRRSILLDNNKKTV